MFVESEDGSVDSDDITNSVDNGKIFEFVSVEDEGGIVVFASRFLSLDVDRWVNDLEGADESLLVGLVGESGIDDGGVEVMCGS